MIAKRNITILALPGTPLSSVASASDVFQTAGVFWPKLTGGNVTPYFDVQLASVDGGPVECMGGIPLTPHTSIHNVKHTDVIVITALLGKFEATDMSKPVLKWLITHHEKNAHIASICTGAFVLAATGLLDGKSATTHWGVADLFQKKFPNVELKPKAIVTDEGNLFCSGGSNAGVDMALYLVGKYCGIQIAKETAKAMVHDFGRKYQSPYAALVFEKEHGDTSIVEVQTLMEQQYERTITVDLLASTAGLSHRTFERRFKSATGDSPVRYLQRVRIEAAKQMLETPNRTFEDITFSVGYEDVSSFRRLFIKHTGLSPSEYRARFCV